AGYAWTEQHRRDCGRKETGEILLRARKPARTYRCEQSPPRDDEGDDEVCKRGMAMQEGFHLFSIHGAKLSSRKAGARALGLRNLRRAEGRRQPLPHKGGGGCFQ